MKFTARLKKLPPVLSKTSNAHWGVDSRPPPFFYMKEKLNALLLALGAIDAAIEDDDEKLTTVTDRVINHFNSVPASPESTPPPPETKWWYVVFLHVTPMGPVSGNIVIKGVHPLVWAKRNSDSDSKIISAGKKFGDIQVLNYIELDQEAAKQLQDEKENPKHD